MKNPVTIGFETLFPLYATVFPMCATYNLNGRGILISEKVAMCCTIYPRQLKCNIISV